MPYFDFASKVPPQFKGASWLLTEPKNIVDVGGSSGNRILNVPMLLSDLGWVHRFQTYLPKDDSFEAEYLLDHNSLHVFDDWTCIMGPVVFNSANRHPLFDMYFRTDIDLLMAKMILL